MSKAEVRREVILSMSIEEASALRDLLNSWCEDDFASSLKQDIERDRRLYNVCDYLVKALK